MVEQHTANTDTGSEDYAEMFCNRYTEDDGEFQLLMNASTDPVPCVERWFVKRKNHWQRSVDTVDKMSPLLSSTTCRPTTTVYYVNSCDYFCGIGRVFSSLFKANIFVAT